MDDASAWVSLFFAGSVVASVGVQAWLLLRHIRHVHHHRGAVPHAFASRVDLNSHQRAADYTVALARLGLLHGVFSGVVWVCWTLMGGLDTLWQWTQSGVSVGWAQPLCLLAAFITIGSLLEWPWSAWRTFRIDARFGFNRTTPSLWWLDHIKSALLSLALLLPLAAAALWMVSWSPDWGWLWIWLLLLAFGALMMVAGPTWLAPLFNRFTPLNDPDLVERLQGLSRRCGFHFDDVQVMDGSRRSSHANAYFTGLGNAKRVVLYDTLLAQLNPSELEAVLAHELGHFRLRHIPQRMASAALQALLWIGLWHWLSSQAGFYSGLGVTPPLLEPQPMVSLLLMTVFLAPLGIWLRPMAQAWSRRHEFQADAYAAQHADPQALAAALVKLHRDNAATLTPDPLYTRFHAAHPTVTERLDRLHTPAGVQL